MKRSLRAAIAALSLLGCVLCPVARAETPVKDQSRVFVLCKPESFVNVRETPRNGNNKIGKAYLGDSFETDGKVQNGFLHITDCPYEYANGWISVRYLTSYEVDLGSYRAVIDADGRVACRNGINGKRTKWIEPGDEVVVLAHNNEWAVTDSGFIRAEFLREAD